MRILQSIAMEISMATLCFAYIDKQIYRLGCANCLKTMLFKDEVQHFLTGAGTS